MPEPAPGGSLLGSPPAGLVELTRRRPADAPMLAGRPARYMGAFLEPVADGLAELLFADPVVF